MGETHQQAAKEAVGTYAGGLVKDGMRVGLGTGSTTAYAITEIGRRIREERISVTGTPTSFAAERLAREVGIPLITLDDISSLDIVLDGADEVDAALNLIKGRGGAHTREKVVASLAREFIALVDTSKRVEQLGSTKPVPVEVLPMAVSPVMRRIEALGGQPEIRMASEKDGPVVTDQGFWIVDAWFGRIDTPDALNIALLSIPGVLDHGLFVGMAHRVLVAEENGRIRTMTRQEKD